MKLSIACPHGKYENGTMRIMCDKGDYCGNVYFKRCKGVWVLNENAARCPLREENQRGTKASKKRTK